MRMRVWLKRIGVVLAIPVVCLLLVSVLLYLPAVQNTAVKKAITFVSESTGWHIDFERMRLSFPLDLSVRNAVIRGVDGEPLVRVGRLTVDVRFRSLLKGYLSVKKIAMESLVLNTGSLLEGMAIQGKAGYTSLSADSVNWKTGWLELNSLVCSDVDVEVLMCDTIAPDSTSTRIDLFVGLKKVEFDNVAWTLRMPCDSIFFNMQIAEAVLLDGFADLGAERYGASGLQAKINELSYTTGTTDGEMETSGFDASFIHLTDVALALDSIYYDGCGTMSASLTACSAKERSGLAVQTMTGHFYADSLHIEIPDFQLATASSMLQLQAAVPWTFDLNGLTLNALARIHKQDVLLLWGNSSKDFQTFYPDTILTIEANVHGNKELLTLQKLEAVLPGAFNVRLSGSVHSLEDERLRSGNIDYEIKTQTLDFVTGMFSTLLPPRFQIPDSISLTGGLNIDQGMYAVDLTATESEGIIRLSGLYDVFKKSYEAFLKIDNFEPVHFMPDDSIMRVSAFVQTKGRGTDPFRTTTHAAIEGAISEFRYGSISCSDIVFSGSLKDNQLQAELKSGFPSVKGSVTVDGTVKKDSVTGFLILDFDMLDFYGLQLTSSPMSTSFQLFSEFATDLTKTFSLDVTLGNWNLNLGNQTIAPKMLTLAFRSNVDTTHATLYAGDMNILLTGNTGLDTITNQLLLLSKEAGTQWKRDTTLNLHTLRAFFPDLSIHARAGRDNPVSHFLQESNTFFDHFRLDATLSPEEGLQVDGALFALVNDTYKIDTIRVDLSQDTLGLVYAVDVVKNRFRDQEPFKLDVDGYVRTSEADVFASFVNSKGEKGLYLGLHAQKSSGGYDFHFYPDEPVIAYLPFTINDNNYFRFINLNRMEADLRFKGEPHHSIWIHSEHREDAGDEMMVELSQLDLQEISQKFAILPALKGILDMTFRYVPEDNSFIIIADGNIDDFYYEGGRVGELLLNASYVPMDQGKHQIDMHAFHDMAEIVSLSILYTEGRDESQMDGFVSLNQLPLQIFNAMIPDQTVRLDGLLNGDFEITGSSSDPMLSGSMKFDKVSAFVAPSSTMLHFDDQPVKMTKNKLTLNKFKIYTVKENPFTIDGSIDATNTSRPVVDLRMSAANMPVIDVQRTPGNLLYGKMSVNFNSTLTGPLQSMRMRGNLRVMGNTNLTYVMLDSPLDTDDHFEDLVTFTLFADSLPRRTDMRRSSGRQQGGSRNTTAETGTDVLLTIHVDPVARLRINMDEAQTNYMEMRGGGDLSLQYTTQGDLHLNGRYIMTEGAIRYTIPVIPLTNFSVKNGSYVDWSGDPFNPYLNISAHTRVRSSVNPDGQSRNVDFNAGIQLKDNLDDVSVQFLLEAPTDAAIQNQLTAMGAEERSKQAISLLVTGVYLASGGAGTGNMDLGAALNSLLQREIKNIVGNMFGDTPITFDVNTYDGTKGMGRRIDYIGRFYKDFFNERLNTSLGLRYSTNDPLLGNSLFLDDVSLGYRLDADGTSQLKLFRSKEYENLFEGEIGKIGASYTIRKKIKRLPDLFIFPRQNAATKKEEEKDEK